MIRLGITIPRLTIAFFRLTDYMFIPHHSAADHYRVSDDGDWLAGKTLDKLDAI
ncbi:MAG: hypothetical protein WEA56_06145 [Balneolaceae bacterium]